MQLYLGTGNHSEGQWLLVITNSLHIHYNLQKLLLFFPRHLTVIYPNYLRVTIFQKRNYHLVKQLP